MTVEPNVVISLASLAGAGTVSIHPGQNPIVLVAIQKGLRDFAELHERAHDVGC